MQQTKTNNYCSSQITGKTNLSFALAYLKKLGKDALNLSEFERESGVGMFVCTL
jgi:hypothetical protein